LQKFAVISEFFLCREMIVQTWISMPHHSRRLQAAHLSLSTVPIIRILIPSSENFSNYILK